MIRNERMRRTLGALLAVAAGGMSQDAATQIFVDGFEAPEHGLASCFSDPDPRNAPEGYTAHDLSWERTFYGQSFPNVDSGGQSPVGSFTFKDQYNPAGFPVTGTYIAVPFVPAASTNYKLEWYRAQAVLSRGYETVYPAESNFVTISPCPGDFRAARTDVPRSDERSSSCRDNGQNGIIYYGTTGAGSACILEAGQTYYLNIIFADPANLDPTTNSCVDWQYCDANFSD